jgi:hypothetical protein
LEEEGMKKLWGTSVLVTLSLSLLILSKWCSVHDNYRPNDIQLTTKESSIKYLKEHFSVNNKERYHNVPYTPVGVYIDSLKFKSPNDVVVSGYLWQFIKHEDESKVDRGIIFPDAIGKIKMDPAYEYPSQDGKTFGWYFEANLRQPFVYKDYPLDHKTVWIRIWPKDFLSDHILLPSLDSYDSTGEGDVFGISKDIVLDGWDINESYFDYMEASFDTDFGAHENLPRKHVPVLTFNIVLNRQLFNAFFLNITLLLVIMTLLFSVLTMFTRDDKLIDVYDFSVGSVIGACAGLFFTILLAHIDLRSSFSGDGIVYLEYFYLLAYFFILGVAGTAYFFAHDKRRGAGVFYKDGIILKLAYWPLYMLISYIFTIIHFRF